MTKITAISVGYPGVTEWLRHGEAVGLWDFVRLGGPNPIEVPDSDIYILGAWHSQYEDLVRWAKSRGSKVWIAWSSSSTEMDHATIKGSQVEIAYTLALTSPPWDKLIDGWACLHPGLAEQFPNGIHLPAPVHVEHHPGSELRSGVGFYAPATPKKNILTQLFAVRSFQRAVPQDEDRFLRTNLESYKPALEGYGIKHRLEGWVESRSEHLDRLSRCRVALSASHAESWCYGAIDALSVGVPVVGSPTIPWLPAGMRVLNPNDPREVLERLKSLWDETRLYEPDECRKIVADVATRQNEAARLAVRKLV